MSKFVKYLFIPFLLAGSLFSCSGEDEEEDDLIVKDNRFDYSTLEDGIPESVVYHVNPKFPQRTDSLRILAIGNSFTDDAMQYMDDMVQLSGIDYDRIAIYVLTEGSSSFDVWINKDYESSVFKLRRMTGGAPMKSKGSLHEMLAQNWDVIVIQQVSDLSYKWNTFSSLREYEEKLLASCTNPSVCLAYQLVWSHSAKEMPYVLEGNIACCKKMMKRHGIDVVIPTGVAIQNARNTTLNDDMYLTRDKWHLNTGIARYIATATWFERMITPVFGVSIRDIDTMPDGDYSSDDIELAKHCVYEAIEHPFEFVF